MILGHVDLAAQEKAFYSPALQRGLQYIAGTDFLTLPAGRQEIDGDNLFALIQDYEPEPREMRKAEIHKKYIDIQYIVSGEELMGHAFLSDRQKACEDCLAERDAMFFMDVEGETYFRVSPGMYAVFFPGDVHRPCCALAAGCGKVRKVVVKVRV